MSKFDFQGIIWELFFLQIYYTGFRKIETKISVNARHPNTFRIIIDIFQDQLKPEIDALLKLKAQYKEVTGSDYQPPSNNTPKKPAMAASAPAPTPALSPEAEKVVAQITEQGDKIRQLKASKAPQVK